MQFLNLKKLNKNYYLIMDSLVIECQIGKRGIVNHTKKIEGDLCTPSGVFSLGALYYRADKVVIDTINFEKVLKVNQITKNCGWCDDPSSNQYNKYIQIKKNNRIFKGSFEYLWRDDQAYDFFFELNFNKNPVKKSKGSAIFLHCSFEDERSTKGCIAIQKKMFFGIHFF